MIAQSRLAKVSMTFNRWTRATEYDAHKCESFPFMVTVWQKANSSQGVSSKFINAVIRLYILGSGGALSHVSTYCNPPKISENL